ncbi:MAG: redoxin domain-containing protein [Verrucomicrobiota bacterium]|nr:redoxin domain-containing protein [Verrucomicrobiota bacterium]
MLKSIVALVAGLAACVAYASTLPPLTVKDVSLMLRSGYSSEAVAREIAARKFLGSVDAAAEKALSQAGATSDLIATLRGGAYGLSPEQAVAAESDLAAKSRLRNLQAEQARKIEARNQNEIARKTDSALPQVAPTNRIIDQIKGDLVTSRNGLLSTFNDQALDKKKLIGLYFSARWCPSCRKFTPTLVDYYNRVAPEHPEFEILFISNDRSEPSMEAYMRDAQMPWPAVRFDKVAEKEAVQKYAGAGIPCLVVIDSDGRVVSHSYEGKTYLGPSKVLSDLDAIFARGDANQVALRH